MPDVPASGGWPAVMLDGGVLRNASQASTHPPRGSGEPLGVDAEPEGCGQILTKPQKAIGEVDGAAEAEAVEGDRAGCSLAEVALDSVNLVSAMESVLILMLRHMSSVDHKMFIWSVHPIELGF
ncbi:hypothetical protein ZWY2020_054919 [Hordeum vulgare]|nr:hypothetical protein ZWY2020_054919 [Hordeum vulgare]